MRDGRTTPTIVLLLLVVVTLSTAASATPTLIIDDAITHPVYIQEGRPYCYTHDITDNLCYCPDFVVCSAELNLRFLDDFCDGPHGQPEYVTALYDGVKWNVGEVDNAWYGMDIDPGLLCDGRLKVKVSVADHGCGSGDVWLKDSILKVWGHCPDTPPAVPVPGTMLLAGLGASVVGWLRRRHAL